MSTISSNGILSTSTPLLRRLSQRLQRPHSAAGYRSNATIRALLEESLRSLLRRPPKAAVLFLAVALLLPAAASMFVSSFKNAQHNLLQSRQITVFLNPKVEHSAATELATALAKNQHISDAVLTTVTVHSGTVQTIDIKPSTSLEQAQLDNVVAELNSHLSVDFVAADSSWLQRNTNAIEQLGQLGWLAVAVITAVTMMLAFLITRTDLLRQRPDLEVLDQMGASRSTLQKPLLVRGLVVTGLAVSLASLLAWFLISLLPQLIDMSSYSRIFPHSIPLKLGLVLVFASGLSSFLAVKLHRNLQ